MPRHIDSEIMDSFTGENHPPFDRELFHRRLREMIGRLQDKSLAKKKWQEEYEKIQRGERIE